MPFVDLGSHKQRFGRPGTPPVLIDEPRKDLSCLRVFLFPVRAERKFGEPKQRFSGAWAAAIPVGDLQVRRMASFNCFRLS